MSNKVTVKFFLHPNVASNGKRKVMGRIIVNRKKAEFATDFEGNSSDWSETKGEFKRNHAANEALFQIKGKVSQIKSFLLLEEKEVNARAIRDLLTERSKLRYGIVAYFEKHNVYRQNLGDLSKSAMDKYIGTKKQLAEFIERKKGVSDLSLKRTLFQHLRFYIKIKSGLYFFIIWPQIYFGKFI